MKTALKRFRIQPRISNITHMIWMGTQLTIILLAISACSRSAWIKSDGHEVAPAEQLACAEEILETEENQVLDHVELQPKIEACMQTKGYHRRPWWLLNDLHWDTRAMP